MGQDGIGWTGWDRMEWIDGSTEDEFFAGSMACVYELHCFQQQYHLVATSVSGS
jgi:hypothetical protein